jgi:hypothetical protein
MLAKSELKQAMQHLFDPASMPADNSVADWCRSYAKYAQKAMAGAVVLASPLVPQSSAGKFLPSLDVALKAMWMSAVWVGPGVTAVTSVVPSVQPFLAGLAPVLVTSFDRGLAATLIADALHTYTLSIVVSVIPPTGTPILITLT